MATTPSIKLVTLVEIADTGGDKTLFGYAWPELLGTVGGFKLRIPYHISSITNLSDVTTNTWQTLEASSDNFYFMLLPDEHIVRVELNYDCDRVCAIRFASTLRFSQWYGQSTGKYVAYEAPESQIIKPVFGKAIECESSATRCVELGVALIASPSKLSSEPAEPIGRFARSNLLLERESEVPMRELFSASLRVVVLRTCPLFYDVAVLSQDQYEELVLQKSAMCAGDENWFVLAPTERILAVGVSLKCSRTKISGLRFRTNLRSSVVFGRNGDELLWFDCEAYPGSVICGFQVMNDSTSDFEIKDIGVIYKLAVENEHASHAA